MARDHGSQAGSLTSLLQGYARLLWEVLKNWCPNTRGSRESSSALPTESQLASRQELLTSSLGCPQNSDPQAHTGRPSTTCAKQHYRLKPNLRRSRETPVSAKKTNTMFSLQSGNYPHSSQCKNVAPPHPHPSTLTLCCETPHNAPAWGLSEEMGLRP